MVLLHAARSAMKRKARSTKVFVSRWLFAFVAASWVAASCSGSGPKAGTNTNWLEHCESDRDCSVGSCLCGICTVACATSSDCSGIQGAVCIATNELGASCVAPSGDICAPAPPNHPDSGDMDSSHAQTDAPSVEAGAPDANSGHAQTDAPGVEAGACRPVTARSYDPIGDCYGPEETLAGLCFRETIPNGTEGTWEMVCLVAADGTRYATPKGYTECLEGDGWSTADTYGIGDGWYVLGEVGLCERSTAFTYADGGVFDDPVCRAAVSRGLWDYGYGVGLDWLDGDGHLILLDGGVAPGEAGVYAGECL